MRLSDRPATDVIVEIGASPSRVWEIVTDIQLPARFSTEFQGAEWVDERRGLGASFIGSNRHERAGEWQSTSYVVAYDEGRTFGWAVSDVDNPGATWRFVLEPVDGGTRLTYRVELGPGPSGLTPIIDRWPDREADILQRRLDEHAAQMQAVVEGIRDLAEAG